MQGGELFVKPAFLTSACVACYDCGQVAASRSSTFSSPYLSTIAPAPLPGGNPMST